MNILAKIIIAFCVVAGQVVAVEWAVGFSGESCSTTCSKLSKTCSLGDLQTVTTSSAFNAALAGATQLGKEEVVSNADSFCSGGVNSWAFATAPASMSYPLYVKDGESDHGTYVMTNSCFFPTGGVQGNCDTVYSVPPAQRICPCV